MKIPHHIQVKSTITAVLLGTAAIFTPIAASNKLEKSPQQDVYEKVTQVPPNGTSDSAILAFAPSAKVKIKDETKTAAIVIDLSKNVLYHYDKNGEPQTAYLIASGKPSCPTHKGVRVVSHIEAYPYKTAYGTKRKKNPKDYGPNAIIPMKVDTQTGELSQTGELIHGNNDTKSLGHYKSKGCIRMDNEVIKELAEQIKSGDIIVIQ